MNFFKRLRDTALVVLLLAVPFFFLRASIRQPEDMNVVDRSLMMVAAPVEYVASALARTVSSFLGAYVFLFDVKANNAKLSYENAQLRARVSELTSMEAENRRYKELLGLKTTLGSEAVSAVVMSKDTTDYFRVTRVALDAAAPGLKPNMPVVSLGGVVGTVLRVAGEKVDVQLTVDSGFGVDVVVERTQARGFVRGTGNEERYLVYVEYVQRDDEIDVGDTLVTSGYGCRFPSGIAVAKVTKVVKREFGIYQQVEAKPTVDFSRLNEVLVLMTDPETCAPDERRKVGNE